MPTPNQSETDSDFTPNSSSLYRVLDAAANRAGEGLRVAEDYARFALDDRRLTELSKTLRHDLTAALATFPPLLRHKARDTGADVGTNLSTPGEQQRTNMAEVCAAAIKRTQQSLRSLEEFSKTISQTAPKQFESIRYRSYTLERCLEINRHSQNALAGARLYVLLDAQPTAQAFEKLVTTLVETGVGLIQLRDKSLDDRRLVERARLLTSITQGTETLSIINDRPDIAALCQADGVHVGQEELSVKDARAIVGPKALVGVSTHNLEQVQQAILDGADYLGAGPTFPSQTKSFDTFPGLDFLATLTQETTLPTFAIGGISCENLTQVLATGVERVAIGSAITQADDPQAAATKIIQSLKTSAHPTKPVETAP